MTARSLLEVRNLCVETPGGRPLLRDLNLDLGRDRVAVLGRNGVGKSTLLELLAGLPLPHRGLVRPWVEPLLVHQDPRRIDAIAVARSWKDRAATDPSLARAWARESAEAGLPPLALLAEAEGLSLGEMRKLHLIAAKLARPSLLLLDEPTRDLDEAGTAWLRRWVAQWSEGLMVVSHDRRLLRTFEHFFIVAESGCRHVPGSLSDVERLFEREDAERQRQYVKNLNVLEQAERHHDTVCRRRRRKKNVGRLHELRRRTSRARLNEKRSYAQESQARQAKIRMARISASRGWAKATRRALTVTLPFEGLVPTLPADDGRALVELSDAGVTLGDHWAFEGVTTRIGRDRVAIVGPNGAGKTTLLQVMLEHHAPTTGTARARTERIGSIAQGATDWMGEDSLLGRLATSSEQPTLETIAQRLVAHRFPLALAERPLRSLSPGERVRAALICLYHRTPSVELLVLDEPTRSLDFLGASALRTALAAWPGGLLVVSHDEDFLESIGIERRIVLAGPRHGVAPAMTCRSSRS